MRASECPGFSHNDQIVLAALVRRHRRSFPTDAFDHLPREWVQPARRLCALLRLAVVLHRGRSRQPLPPLKLTVNQQRLDLRFPAVWLDEHPLTRADLHQAMQGGELLDIDEEDLQALLLRAEQIAQRRQLNR